MSDTILSKVTRHLDKLLRFHYRVYIESESKGIVGDSNTKGVLCVAVPLSADLDESVVGKQIKDTVVNSGLSYQHYYTTTVGKFLVVKFR